MTITTHTPSTTEVYLHAVRDFVIERGLASGQVSPEEADKLRHIKLLYGVGTGGYRGITFFQAWQNGDEQRTEIVEVAATGQESWIQLAGTTIHELAHVLAGAAAGHDADWKDTAVALGFNKRPLAAGQVYYLAMFAADVRLRVYELAKLIGDGSPEFRLFALPTLPTVPRACTLGHGTKGGRSRGKGSGSRMRLWECQCTPKPVKVRVASDDFQATCNRCNQPFERR